MRPQVDGVVVALVRDVLGGMRALSIPPGRLADGRPLEQAGDIEPWEIRTIPISRS